MPMALSYVLLLVMLIAAAGCARSFGTTPVAAGRAVEAVPSFRVPAKIAFGVPRRPEFATPAEPSLTRRAPLAAAAHAGFFAGEVLLSNGVYYLQLPNGNPFGYYAYLPDQNYIYHFDTAYEYVFDANDGQGGVYLYDFASLHWWYTSRTFPFPYLYDFSLNALLYYYPDASPGRYTHDPRWFFNFGTNQIIALPDPAPRPVASPNSLTFTTTGAQAALPFTASEQQYTGSFTVGAAPCAGIATVASEGQPNAFTVTPVAAGACNLTLSDSNGRNTQVGVSVTSTTVIAE
jgi:hypothetical protein